MHTLSTSIVSLHSHIDLRTNEEKSGKKSNRKPSILYFLAIFYSFLSMGLGSGLIGPTLLKFVEQTKSSLDQVVYILFTRALGFLAGTLTGGILIDFFPLFGRTFLTLTMFLMCTTTLIIPFVNHLIPMIIVHLLWSMTAGLVDNLAQILTIRHYEQMNVNPYLQALHGAFGIGAFLSPIIIAPFLKDSSPIDQWHYAYWLIGFLHIPSFIWMFIYAARDEFCLEQITEINLENKEFVSEDKQINTIIVCDEQRKASEKPRSGSILVLSLIIIFILLYVGCESSFAAYLHTYASLHLNFGKDIAAYLNSAFWASFALGRLCGIPLSIKLSPLQMLVSDLIASNGSIILLFILNKSSLILWFGSIIFGFAIGSIYPSVIGYTEKQISLTGRRMSILAIGGSAGDGLIPLFIGYMIDSKFLGPIGFIIISLIVMILSSVIFACTALFVKYRPKEEQNK